MDDAEQIEQSQITEIREIGDYRRHTSRDTLNWGMCALGPRVDRVDWVMLDAVVRGRAGTHRRERRSFVVDVDCVTVHWVGHVLLVVVAVVQ